MPSTIIGTYSYVHTHWTYCTYIVQEYVMFESLEVLVLDVCSCLK